MGVSYYLICKDCKQEYGLDREGMWVFRHIVSSVNKDKKKVKEYFGKGLTDSVAGIIKTYSKEGATNIIERYFQRILNTIMFLLKHSEHSIYLYNDHGYVLKDINKWFEGKMEILSSHDKEFWDFYKDFKEDDLVWDKKFKGYQI